MASSMQHPVYTQEILEETAVWHFRDSIELPSGLEQYCKANSAIEFIRGDSEVSFCVLVSAGCSHVACVEACPTERSIKVTVYHLRDGFELKWTVTYRGTDEEFRPKESSSWYDSSTMHGGITDDGQSVLLVYKPVGGLAAAYVVNPNGFTWRKPPSDTDLAYSSSTGQLSEDSEYLFYTRSGAAFGKNGEAKVVEAYSIRHLARVRAVTFGFGDGRHLRNTRLLPQLRVRGPIYMAIETSSFDGEDGQRKSPSLVASSDRKLHWNFAGIEEVSSRGGSSISISADDTHMFYVEPNTAMLYHWDLKTPSLRPLGSVRLPGVQYSPVRKWLMYGKETTMRDAIPKQIRRARYSPNCKVITIVTANNSTVVINVLLTFNLQLVYHQTLTDPKWPEFLPLCIGFNDSTGLNVFAMYPAATMASDTQPGLVRLGGVSGILIPLPEVFKKIKIIEDYFDSTSDRAASLVKAVDNMLVDVWVKTGYASGVLISAEAQALFMWCKLKALGRAVKARLLRRYWYPKNVELVLDAIMRKMKVSTRSDFARNVGAVKDESKSLSRSQLEDWIRHLVEEAARISREPPTGPSDTTLQIPPTDHAIPDPVNTYSKGPILAAFDPRITEASHRLQSTTYTIPNLPSSIPSALTSPQQPELPAFDPRISEPSDQLKSTTDTVPHLPTSIPPAPASRQRSELPAFDPRITEVSDQLKSTTDTVPDLLSSVPPAPASPQETVLSPQQPETPNPPGPEWTDEHLTFAVWHADRGFLPSQISRKLNSEFDLDLTISQVKHFLDQFNQGEGILTRPQLNGLVERWAYKFLHEPDDLEQAPPRMSRLEIGRTLNKKEKSFIELFRFIGLHNSLVQELFEDHYQVRISEDTVSDVSKKSPAWRTYAGAANDEDWLRYVELGALGYSENDEMRRRIEKVKARGRMDRKRREIHQQAKMLKEKESIRDRTVPGEAKAATATNPTTRVEKDVPPEERDPRSVRPREDRERSGSPES